ncbi:MAG: hypothetical protein KGL39_56975 [Patescibacteria group bacterium]|nr:hypothetical protein [Patescibacteria group bacterium]
MPDEDEDDDEKDDKLGIPDFLKRAPNTPKNQAAEIRPSADVFDKFRVDPAEIETRIKVEADRRWRNWTPSREHLTRPRKSFFLREARKEFYP